MAGLTATALLLTGCSQSYQKVTAQPEDRPQAGASGPTSPEPSSDLFLARAALERQDPESAIGHLKKAISENKALWEAYHCLGVAYVSLGEYSLARRMFAEALSKVGPNDKKRSNIYCEIARSWELQGKIAEARLNYHTANNLNPESATASSALLRLSPSSSR